MKTKTTLISICFGMLSAVSLIAHSQILLEETFESGNMSTTTNADGFRWESNNRTSVVTEAPSCGGLSAGTPTAIYNNSVICNGPQTPAGSGNWIAKNGENSLRFRYSAGQPWTEQRYFLNSPGYPELWISYWLRVPTNYVRGPVSGYNGAGNNKFFSILMGRMPEEYQTSYVSSFFIRDWPNSNPNNMDVDIEFNNGTDNQATVSSRHTNFVTPADAGRWMHLVYHLKASATTSSTDGVLQLYRKWDGESNYTSIVKLSNLNVGVGQGSLDAGFTGWAGGYLMGYHNAPFAEDTEWLLDDFIVSDTPPADIFAVAPMPPSLATVQ